MKNDNTLQKVLANIFYITACPQSYKSHRMFQNWDSNLSKMIIVQSE
jgi:hypothetical protein